MANYFCTYKFVALGYVASFAIFIISYMDQSYCGKLLTPRDEVTILYNIDKATTIEIHAATAAGDMLMFKTHATYTMTQPMIEQQCVFDIQWHATYLMLHYAT